MAVDAAFPSKFRGLFEPKRYKVRYGGRGGAKSWNFARALLIHGTGQTYFARPLRILCTREIQRSIRDSVHHLLQSQITALGLDAFYRVQETGIYGLNGTEFLFAGLKQNIANLKSYEDIDICWVEEAQTVSKQSWEVLIPTIRKDGSEIWASFNPELATDDTYQRFVISPPTNADVLKVNHSDNPWFPAELRDEMEALKAKSPDDYEHVYEGACKQVVEGAIYRNELLAAEKEGRICRVPYDKARPVDTFWDLGFGDMVSIWFAQAFPMEFRLVDYLQGCQQDIAFYLKALQDRGYVYGTHYLPHDATHKTLAAGGRSIQEQIGAGRKVEIVTNLSVNDGIQAARAIFNRCWFDAEKCADGLQALRHYRYEKDENLGTFKAKPLHDWASHPADAFRYFAVAIREPKRQQQKVAQEMYRGNQGWMA